MFRLSTNSNANRFTSHGFYWPTTNFLIDEKKELHRSRRSVPNVDERFDARSMQDFLNSKPRRQSILSIGTELEKDYRYKKCQQNSNESGRRKMHRRAASLDKVSNSESSSGIVSSVSSSRKKSLSAFSKAFGKSFDLYFSKNSKQQRKHSSISCFSCYPQKKYTVPQENIQCEEKQKK